MYKLPILKNSNGEKLYPVCSWKKNQHKIYNALTRAENREYDLLFDENCSTEEYKKALNEVKLLSHLVDVIDGRHYQGIVYATWEDSRKIKEYIMAYDLRH